MSKSKSLLFLVNSMTRSEKKAFRVNSGSTRKVPEYMVLYDLIDQNKTVGVEEIKTKFLEQRPGVSFDATVKYLYKIILDSITELKKEQESDFNLMYGIMKAKILYEKSLFEDCFALLKRIIHESEKQENLYSLLIASKHEIEFLLALNYPSTDEKTLLKKHFQINKTLRAIMKINEQSSIYELLMHRIIHKGNIRSQEQKYQLNDLVVSEISIMSTSSLENFEINKLHQLFQANYLISVGDYKSAYRSFNELNRLFENNKHLWNNPPVYYLQTVEGVLDSLRGIRNYKGMDYFIKQLEKLESSSINFDANVKSIIFLYNLFPSLDQGEFEKSLQHLEENRNSIYSKLQLMPLTRQAELHLYASLVYFTNRNFKKAHSNLKLIILEVKGFFYLPLYRTIRLANMMILYELKDFEQLKYIAGSLKRDIKKNEKGYLIEKAILRFINIHNRSVNKKKNKDELLKILEGLDSLSQDVFEHQVLKIFDFNSWIKSKITREHLANIYHSNQSLYHPD